MQALFSNSWNIVVCYQRSSSNEGQQPIYLLAGCNLVSVITATSEQQRLAWNTPVDSLCSSSPCPCMGCSRLMEQTWLSQDNSPNTTSSIRLLVQLQYILGKSIRGPQRWSRVWSISHMSKPEVFSLEKRRLRGNISMYVSTWWAGVKRWRQCFLSGIQGR